MGNDAEVKEEECEHVFECLDDEVRWVCCKCGKLDPEYEEIEEE